MRRLLVAAVLAVLALPAPSALAQTGTARGKVVDEQGKPLAGVKLTLEFQGGVNRTFETDSNKNGEFTQVGLQPGPYRLTAAKDGYEGTFVVTRIRLGDPTYVPDLVLKKPSPAKAADKSAEEVRDAFKKALDLTQGGKLEEAEAAYKEILAKKPDIPEVHFNLGLLYSQRKDWTQAAAVFEKAIELRPDYTDAVVELARAYQHGGQSDKGLETIGKAAAANAGDAKLQFNLGVFFINAGRSEEALAAFQKAEALDPNNAEVQFHLGTLAVGQNKVPEAIARLEKYLSMSPKVQQNVAIAQGLLAALKPKK